jgi:hypothetical protein
VIHPDIYAFRTHSRKIRQNPRLTPPETESRQTRTTRQISQSREDKQPNCEAEGHVKQESDQKRKRSPPDEDLGSQDQDKQSLKKPRVLSTDIADALGAQEVKGDRPYNPIKHWADTGFWPENWLEMGPQSTERSSKNTIKSKATQSYSQGFRDGENPSAYSREYESHLRSNGIIMDIYQGATLVSEDSKSLCIRLRQGKGRVPQHTLFPTDKLLDILERVRYRNEQRIYRDIMPMIVPSAELLFFNGESELEHLAEEMSAGWTKCTTLAGPQPRPDFAVGLMSSAFTDEELVKLKHYTASDRASLFTENMYYPFLMCEAKCGDQGIDGADLQNMQSCSMAVNAVVQLYREADKNQSPPRLQELNRQILAFSVSHDHRNVRIHGHFALIGNDRTTFHRYLIISLDMASPDSQKDWTAYNFTRQIYSNFVPDHLKRIRDALATLDDPPQQSFTSGMSIEEPDSQESEAIVPVSEGTADFKKPPLPPMVRIQQENERLNHHLDQLLKEQQELQQEKHRLIGQFDMLLQNQQEQQRHQQEQQRHRQEQITKLQDLLLEQRE